MGGRGAFKDRGGARGRPRGGGRGFGRGQGGIRGGKIAKITPHPRFEGMLKLR